MLCWTDSLEIAISLEEKSPNIDPTTINFVDLRQLVMNLEDFKEGQSNCGERVLEAIQMHWIEEKE
jgi:FeS assembly protein IscX